mgnify:CR=1 FL=1
MIKRGFFMLAIFTLYGCTSLNNFPDISLDTDLDEKLTLDNVDIQDEEIGGAMETLFGNEEIIIITGVVNNLALCLPFILNNFHISKNTVIGLPHSFVPIMDYLKDKKAFSKYSWDLYENANGAGDAATVFNRFSNKLSPDFFVHKQNDDGTFDVSNYSGGPTINLGTEKIFVLIEIRRNEVTIRAKGAKIKNIKFNNQVSLDNISSTCEAM